MAPQKLNIAVWHNLPSGGGKRALYEHVKGLAQRGHHIEVWCPSTADMDYLPLSEFAQEHVIPFHWQSPPKSGRVQNIMYPYRWIETKLSAMERHCAECAKEISAKKFDVLFVNACMFFRSPPLARMLNQLPSVIYLGEPYRWLYEALPSLPWLAMPDSGENPYTPKRLKRFLRDLIQVQGYRLQAREERRNAEVFGRILVNSLYSRESILRAYGLDSTVCYLGVDGELFSPNGAVREGFVIGLGSLTPEKGPDVAIRALAAIPAKKRPELKWVGNVAFPHYLDELVKLAADLNVRFDPKVNVSDSELIDLLNRASLMLYTSQLEPFGFAPLEANACGTPVVAIAEGGVRETVFNMENGLLVHDRDPQTLGRAVLTLLDNEQLTNRLGNAGRQMVEERWTWESAIDNLEAQLIRIIAVKDGGERGLKNEL